MLLRNSLRILLLQQESRICRRDITSQKKFIKLETVDGVS